MVKLTEVPDEAFATSTGDDEGEWDTDSESDLSSVASSDSLPADETLVERLLALADAIPPAQRRRLASTASATKSWGWWGVQLAGRSLWTVSVSVLLLVTPFALASLEDQQIAMEEKQMEMQRGANEIITPGSQGGQQGRPAL